MGFELLIDACVLINLVATEKLDEIRTANDIEFLMARPAAAEALYTVEEGQSGSRRIPIVIEDLERAGSLVVLDLTDEERETFIEIAADIDDGEAATLAVAHHRGLRLATDDRGALRYIETRGLINPAGEPVRTSSLIRQWAEVKAVDESTAAEVLRRVRESARFEPSRRDPNHAWWTKTTGA